MNQKIFCYSSQSYYKLTKKTVGPVYGIGICLRLHQQTFWQKLITSLPIVGTDETFCNMLYLFPQYHSSFCSSRVNLAIDETVPIFY
jgi:hypothetical protein